MSADEIATSLAGLPPDLRVLAEQRWNELHPKLNVPMDAAVTTLAPVLALSDFVWHAGNSHPHVVADLVTSGDLAAPYAPTDIARRVKAALADAGDIAELKRRLRALRRREWLRLAWRDLSGRASLAEIMATLSAFADALIDAALEHLTADAYARHGTPRAPDGSPLRLAVLALGKLGGNELNFSSDIDLIFCYPVEGQIEDGLSHHEFFLRLGQALINVLSEATADGFVFRVDMRLRPNGASGPLALSFEAMEHYYQTHGREWERYAVIKARACAGDVAAGAALLAQLGPFVYRRYLDYGMLDAIRAMKAMIVAEVARKGMADNIKLGAGGIREIEFIAQTLQLIRGGRERALQVRPTRAALAQLAQAGHLDADAARELDAAYEFLRNVEHRLQMAADQQTHQLPTDEPGRARLAAALALADVATLQTTLDRHRARVQTHFAALLAGDATAPPADAASAWLLADDAAAAALARTGYAEPAEALALIRGLRQSATCRVLTADGRARLDRLMPRVLTACAATREPLTTLARVVRLLEAIGRRTAYFVLLTENAAALTQLVKLAAASRWIATWIGQNPVLLDELLDPRALYALSDRATLEADLRARLAGLPEDDLEARMNALREFRNGQMLRVAARDLGPGLAPEDVGRQLSELAELLVGTALEVARAELVRRHGQPRDARGAVPGFAVIGYGKLGSLELGYGSDLDMVFVYEAGEGQTDGARPMPNELYFARLGQRLIHILTARTPAGVLYEVDMRLRPSGRSGLLVTSIDAYRAYQTDKAWTWEHQALVRARPVAGTSTLYERFEEIRRDVLRRARDPAGLRADVRDMRERMRAARAPESDTFDVKHSRGGIVDIEFMVQYWALRWAHDHPAVTRHTDNIHILQSLADVGAVEPQVAGMLADAYRRLLAIEHRLKLMEGGGRVSRAELGDVPERVARLWQTVIESGE